LILCSSIGGVLLLPGDVGAGRADIHADLAKGALVLATSHGLRHVFIERCIRWRWRSDRRQDGRHRSSTCCPCSCAVVKPFRPLAEAAISARQRLTAAGKAALSRSRCLTELGRQHYLPIASGLRCSSSRAL
jgi:hypothetical protein